LQGDATSAALGWAFAKESAIQNLDRRLRSTLEAARCNTELRDRLSRLVEDQSWLEPIVSELGKNHALVIELFRITKRAA
jgi:hypothetical protein